ncbi:MAG: LEA type 2 family protein [Alphaproteobacteria bacterium]
MPSILRPIVPFLVLVVTACAAVGPVIEPPDVALADIQFLDAGVFEQRFRVTLRVRNPNDFSLPLDGFRFNLDVNEKPFARGVSNSAVTIPRLGEALVDVDTSTSVIDIAQLFMDLPTRETLDYTISGRVYLRGSILPAVPFEETGSLSLPTTGIGLRILESMR